jgi:hypothetical protein
MKQFDFAWIIALGLVITSCGSDLDCAIRGNNVEGYVTFTQAYPASTTQSVTIQLSEDDFTTVTREVRVANTQKFLTVGYSICANAGTAFKVRAFQDLDTDGTWESGEGAGRNDGTSTGHGTYTSHLITNSTSKDWNVESDVNIYLDVTTSQ